MLPTLATTENHIWEQERARLVALCVRFTGNLMAAEDLAQETLYEAWRHRERLHDARGLSAWLAAIARNVYLRWRTHHHQDALHQAGADMSAYADTLADPFDLATSIADAETSYLLERALALLPSTTRQALLEHCLLGAPFAAIAAKQGLAEAAVKMQVQRGKRRLRQLLATTFAPDAQACGLVADSEDTWLPTPLWCPHCGQRHLEGQWDFAKGTLRLRCCDCLSLTGIHSAYDAVPELFHGVSGLKAG